MGDASDFGRAVRAWALCFAVMLTFATAVGCTRNAFEGDGALPSPNAKTLVGSPPVVAMRGDGRTAKAPTIARWAYLRTSTRQVYAFGESDAGRRVWVAPLDDEKRRLALLDRGQGLVVLDLTGDRIAEVGRLPLHADPLDLVLSGSHLYLVTQSAGDHYEVTVARVSNGRLTRLSATRHDGFYAGLWATAGQDERDHVYLADNVAEPHPHEPKCAWPGAQRLRPGILEGGHVHWEPALKLPKPYLSVTRRGPFLLPSNVLGEAPNRSLFGAATDHLIDLRPHLQRGQPPELTPAPDDLGLYAATYADGTLWLAGETRKPDGSTGYALRSFGSARNTRCDVHRTPAEKQLQRWAIEGPIDIMVEGNVARIQHYFHPPHAQTVSTIDLKTCTEQVDGHAGQRQWLLEGQGVLLGGATPEAGLTLVTGPSRTRRYRIPVEPDAPEIVPLLGADGYAIDVPAIESTAHAFDRHFLLPPSGQPLEFRGTPLVATAEGSVLLLSEPGMQLVAPDGQMLDAAPEWAADKDGALLGDITMRVRYEGFQERPERNSERAFLPASTDRTGPARLRVTETAGEYRRVGDLLVRIDAQARPCRIEVYDLKRPDAPPTRLLSDVACLTRFEREGKADGPDVELHATSHALVFSQPEGRFEKTGPYAYRQLSRELVNYVLDLGDPKAPKLRGPQRTRRGEFVTQAFVEGDILNLVVRPEASAEVGSRFVRGVNLQEPAEPRALPPLPIPGPLVAHADGAPYSVFSASAEAPAHILSRPRSEHVQYDFGDRQIGDVVLASGQLLITHYPLPGERKWEKRPATLTLLHAETLVPQGTLPLKTPVRVLAADSRFALLASDDPCIDGVQHLLIDLAPPSPRNLGPLRSFTLLDTEGDEVLILRGGELQRLRLRELRSLLIGSAR